MYTSEGNQWELPLLGRKVGFSSAGKMQRENAIRGEGRTEKSSEKEDYAWTSVSDVVARHPPKEFFFSRNEKWLEKHRFRVISPLKYIFFYSLYVAKL